jgi:hypothetical protein
VFFDVGDVNDPQSDIAADSFIDRPDGRFDRGIGAVDSDDHRRRRIPHVKPHSLVSRAGASGGRPYLHVIGRTNDAMGSLVPGPPLMVTVQWRPSGYSSERRWD